jgi:hypothetical protein
MMKDDFAHRRAHGDFENSGASNVATDADKLQAARAARALPANQSTPRARICGTLMKVSTLLSTWAFAETRLHGERRFVARFGAMPSIAHQRGFLSADVAAGLTKTSRSESNSLPRIFPKKAGAAGSGKSLRQGFLP